MAKDLTKGIDRERKFAVTVSSPSECKRVLSIEVSSGELEQEQKLVRNQLRRDLKIPGFRKGKVPAAFIEKNYAKMIRTDAVQNLLPQVYRQALVREGIDPIGDPTFENVNTEGDAVTMDVTVEIKPDVSVTGYRGASVKVEARCIEDADVEKALGELRERLTTFQLVDRPVRDGDLAIIDYGPLLDSGEVDKTLFAENYTIDLGGETLLKEFREGLVGMEIGEEKEISVKYPEDFPEKDAAGTSKVFRTRVKEIKERQVPELDDEFARRLDEQFTDLGMLRERIRADMVKDEEKRFKHAVEEALIDHLIEKNSFEVPETMVNNYVASVLEEDRRRRPQVDDEAVREKEVREHFHAAAVRTIKKYFILDAVRKQENIEVPPEVVDSKIEEVVAESGERADDVRRYFADPQRRRSLANELLDEKILNFLRDGADIKVA